MGLSRSQQRVSGTNVLGKCLVIDFLKVVIALIVLSARANYIGSQKFMDLDYNISQLKFFQNGCSLGAINYLSTISDAQGIFLLLNQPTQHR